MTSRDTARHAQSVLTEELRSWSARAILATIQGTFALSLGLGLLSGLCTVCWSEEGSDAARTQKAPSSCALIEPGGRVIRFANGRRITQAEKGTPIADASPPVIQQLHDPMSDTQRVVDPITATAQKVCADGVCTIDVNWTGTSEPVTIVAASDVGFQHDVETIEHEVAASSKLLETPHHDLFVDIVETNGDVVSRAVTMYGYEPLPLPRLSGFATQAWWGDSVTVTGKYLDAIPGINLAAFGGRTMRGSAGSTVPSGDGFASEVAFTVPSDARGTYLQVQANGKTSAAPNTFLALTPTGVGPYGEIRGVVWVPDTGMVWVAADGQIDKIDLFHRVPVPTSVVTGLTKPYISRVSASSNEIVYVDGVDGVGEIRVINQSTGSNEHFANTTDANFTRSMLPVGIGISNDGSACFIADASGGAGAGCLVKIPRGNTSDITDVYGDYQGWSFPDPCGMDMADNGDLYAPTSDAVLVVTSPSDTYTDITVSSVRSIELDRDASSANDHHYFMARAAGFAEAFNTNQIEYGTGSSSGERPPRYLGGIVFARSDGLLQLDPDWFYAFSQQSPQRILLTNADPEWPYLSSHQSQDYVIEMQITGWHGVKLQLELIDPPDLAPYDSKDLDNPTGFLEFPYNADDNVGEASAAYGLTLSSDGSSPAQELVVTPGADDVATFYLRVPPNVSGNNYQIQAVKYDSVANQPIADRVPSISPVYTTWKRIYIERDRMFSRGGLLARNFNPSTCGSGDIEPECNQLIVFDWADVSPGDEIVLVQKGNRFGDGGETRAVVTKIGSVNDPYTNSKRLTLDRDLAALDIVWMASSTQPATVGATAALDFSRGNAAGIGVTSGCEMAMTQNSDPNPCLLYPDLRDAERVFADAFVKVLAPQVKTDSVPFVSPAAGMFGGFLMGPGGTCAEPNLVDDINYDQTHDLSFGRMWFDEIDNPNYILVAGASRSQQLDSCTVCVGERPHGMTNGISVLGERISYIFVDSIADFCASSEWTSQAIRNVTNHEIVHQFIVNPVSGVIGHCDRCSWTSDPTLACTTPSVTCPDIMLGCLMGNAHRWATLNRLDRFELACGDPGCPNGSPGCCSSCGVPGDGSIRHFSDPVAGGSR